MEIHQHNAIFPFKGCLGGAGLYTGSTLTVVTGDQKWQLFEFFRQKLIFLIWKGVFKMLFPDPLHLLVIVDRTGTGVFFLIWFMGKIRDIMGFAARFRDIFSNLLAHLVHIDHHAPAMG